MSALEELAKILRATSNNQPDKPITCQQLADACELAAQNDSYHEWEREMGDDL